MLNDDLVERILTSLPSKRIGLVGDLFLDRYLDIDAALTEPSIETGLDAYQVTRVRSYAGALGTVVNNLVSLGVGEIVPLSVIGDDGEGYELRQALRSLPAVRCEFVFCAEQRRTPTYTKPMLHASGAPPRELNRFDIKNRTRTPEPAFTRVLHSLMELLPRLDAAIVLDQVSEPESGVIVTPVREWLAEFGAKHPNKFILADSRQRIGLFRNVRLKPNVAECLSATNRPSDHWRQAIRDLAGRANRAVFCTRGEAGMALLENEQAELQLIPAYPVTGAIDVVGAGDSCSAGIVCAAVCGAQPAEAAAFGNLIASITVQQIGVTGSASPAQVRARWLQVAGH